MKRISYILHELFKFKGSTLTKIVSLVIGLSVGILTFSYCTFEMTYDNYHREPERIFRIGNKGEMPYIKVALLDEVRQDIPEIEYASCVAPVTGIYQTDKYIYYRDIIYADSSFFHIFSISMLSGDPVPDMNAPDNIYLSERFARTVFGDSDPIGQSIKSNERTLTVAGIFKTIPRNSDLRFEAIRPLKVVTDWEGTRDFYGYVKLIPGAEPESIVKKIQAISDKHQNQDQHIRHSLHPLRDLHLKYGVGYSYILIVGITGLVIVLISALNYILISISTLVNKTKEIGIHKVNGASTGDIFSMFFSETLFLVTISGLLAAALLFFLQTEFEYLMYINYSDLFSPQVLTVTGCFIIFMLFLTGYAPAKLFSSVPVLQIFRQTTTGHRSWKYGLLWFQFASTCLLLTTLIIFNGQYRFMMDKNLGYNTKGLYHASVICGGTHPTMSSTRAELGRLPYITGMTFANTLPLWANSTTIFDQDAQGLMESCSLETDKDFFRTFEIPLLESGNPSGIFNDPNSVIVNEQFHRKLATFRNKDKEFLQGGRPAIINGTCKDFQVLSMYASQQPLLIRSLEEPDTAKTLKLILRISPATPENIEETWLTLRKISGQNDLMLQNYKATYEGGYEGEKDICTTVQLFSVLAIIIIVLGLFGFTGDEVSRRTKEIAIRKINGASMNSITFLLLRNIGILALLSLPLSLAGAYFIGQIWLNEFAYSIPLTIWIFGTGAGATLIVIVLTVLLKSYRGLHTRPVEALKSE